MTTNDDLLDALVARARRRLHDESDMPPGEADLAPLVVRAAACALAPDTVDAPRHDGTANVPPPYRVSDWPRLATQAAAWLGCHRFALAEALERDGRRHMTKAATLALVARHTARLAGLTADLLTSHPLAPPVVFIDHLPDVPEPVARHALIFEAWPHATHEVWPLLVDAIEANAAGSLRGQAIAAHASWLDDDLRLRRALWYDAAADRLVETDLDPPQPILSAHLLAGPPGDERGWHATWSARCAGRGVAVANPGAAAALADDKWATYHCWRHAGISTPRTWLIAREASPNERRRTCVEAARPPRAAAGAQRFVVKPRHGTEARGVTVHPADADELATAVAEIADEDDALVQEYRGGLRWRDDDGTLLSATLRLHVAMDGGGMPCVESGYVHVAGDASSPIASLGRYGRARPIVRERLYIVAADGGARALQEDEAVAMAAVARDALRALASEGEPLRLAGLDLVAEADAAGHVLPFALEANAQPAGLGHSRFLAPGWQEAGLPGVSVVVWEGRE